MPDYSTSEAAGASAQGRVTGNDPATFRATNCVVSVRQKNPAKKRNCGRPLHRAKPDEIRAALAARTVKNSDGCLIWTRSLTGDGYAQIRVDGRLVLVHRLAYELERGPIPAGLELDHLCRTRHCLNVSHIEPVTHAENLRRGAKPHRSETPSRKRRSTQAHRDAVRRHKAKRRASRLAKELAGAAS